MTLFFFFKKKNTKKMDIHCERFIKHDNLQCDLILYPTPPPISPSSINSNTVVTQSNREHYPLHYCTVIFYVSMICICLVCGVMLGIILQQVIQNALPSHDIMLSIISSICIILIFFACIFIVVIHV